MGKKNEFELGLYGSKDGKDVAEAFEFCAEIGVVWYSQILPNSVCPHFHNEVPLDEFKRRFPVKVTGCKVVRNRKRKVKVLGHTQLRKGKAYASEDGSGVAVIYSLHSFHAGYVVCNKVFPVYDPLYERLLIDDFLRQYPLEVSGCVIEEKG